MSCSPTETIKQDIETDIEYFSHVNDLDLPEGIANYGISDFPIFYNLASTFSKDNPATYIIWRVFRIKMNMGNRMDRLQTKDW